MKIITNKLFKLLITIVLSLLVLICIKTNSSFKMSFYKYIYESNISFAKINALYNNYFGKIIPTNNLEVVKPVFHESLIYQNKEEYKDGVNLTIDNDYLVPAISSGVVVYIGPKEGYGNVLIINNEDGIDIWYGNMDSIDLKIYDYVDKGTYIGKASKNLYLVFKKNGKVLDYDKYI